MIIWFHVLLARLSALFRREAVIREIDEEMRSHIEMEAQAHTEKGLMTTESAG